MKQGIINEEGVKQYDFRELMMQYDVKPSDDVLYKYLTGGTFAFGESQIEWSDYSTLDSLYLLKQLREYTGGDILMSMGGLNERRYHNAEALVKSLIDTLCDKIRAMIIIEAYDWDLDACVKVGYDDIDRLENTNENDWCYWLSLSICHINSSPRIICQSKESFLSDAWINDIIRMMEEDKKYDELMLGQNIKGTKIKSRLPHLGFRAMHWLHYLPDRWSQTDRLCFLADLLNCEGELNFKGKIFLDDYCNMTRKEKADMVKSWLDSYDRLRNKMH